MMPLSDDLRVLPNRNPARRISRRELARVLIAAAPALSLSSVSLAHPVWEHLRNLELSDSAEAQLSAASWKPLVLSVNQEESFRLLAEAVLPGSTKALVSRFVDLLLSVETTVKRNKFLGSFTALDDEATKSLGKPIRELNAQQMEKFLTSISSQSLSGGPDAVFRGHFEDLKEWITGAYYSSEIGMRELGWRPDRVFSSFPACEHPEGHV